jgi:hypothetical protein
MPSLRNPNLKTSRAKEHLDALHRGIDAFKKSDPCTVRPEYDSEGRHKTLRITLEAVPDRVCMIVGDFVTCLRAALDQLAWQLALLTTPTPRVKTNQFPIFDHMNGDNPRRYRLAVRDIPPRAETIIASLQPHLRGNAFPDDHLWRLNALCNTDKHREIPVRGIVTDVVLRPFGGIVRAFSNGNIVMETIPGRFEANVQFDPHPPVEIIFGNRAIGVEVGLPDLVAIYEAVCNDIIPKFAGFFP